VKSNRSAEVLDYFGPFCFAVCSPVVVLLNCRYYKVNEVQKFTYSRRKDTNTSDVTVNICAVEYFSICHRLSSTVENITNILAF